MTPLCAESVQVYAANLCCLAADYGRSLTFGRAASPDVSVEVALVVHRADISRSRVGADVVVALVVLVRIALRALRLRCKLAIRRFSGIKKLFDGRRNSRMMFSHVFWHSRSVSKLLSLP